MQPQRSEKAVSQHKTTHAFTPHSCLSFSLFSGLYYGVACSHLLGEPDLLDRASLLQRIHACRNADGGYAGNVGHDSHILHTYRWECMCV